MSEAVLRSIERPEKNANRRLGLLMRRLLLPLPKSGYSGKRMFLSPQTRSSCWGHTEIRPAFSIRRDTHNQAESVSPTMESCELILIAADHGLAAEGMSAYPVSVTRQMVENFLAQPAMEGGQIDMALEHGRELVHTSNADVVCFGEMGIGNNLKIRFGVQQGS